MAQLSLVESLPRSLKRRVRGLYYDADLSMETILERVDGLSESDLRAILNEPDDLDDYRLHHIPEDVRLLQELSHSIIESITDADLEKSTLSARATLLKNARDIQRHLLDMHSISQMQSEDIALARLLELGRDEARHQLIDRFRSLAHILFGGMDTDEVMQALSLMKKEAHDLSTEEMVYASDVEDAEEVSSADVPLRLVQDGGTNASTSSEASQRIGAFRGPKEG